MWKKEEEKKHKNENAGFAIPIEILLYKYL